MMGFGDILRFRVMVAAAVAVVAGACARVEPVLNMEPISYQAVVGSGMTRGGADEPVGTKAVIEGNEYGADAPSFGAAAFYNRTGETFPTGSQLYIPESEVKWNEESSRWSTDTPYYWPKAGSLTFFAFSPWSINEDVAIDPSQADCIKIENWDVAANQGVDIMIADVNTGLTGNSSAYGTGADAYQGVPTVFRHKLAQISGFEVRRDDTDRETDNYHSYKPGDIEIFVNKIALRNICMVGTYKAACQGGQIASEAWNKSGDIVDEYVYFENPDYVFENMAPSTGGIFAPAPLLVVPQTFEDGSQAMLYIEYGIIYFHENWIEGNDDGYTLQKKTASINLSEIEENHEWKMNGKIRYSITIGLGDRIHWVPSSTVWDASENISGGG